MDLRISLFEIKPKKKRFQVCFFRIMWSKGKTLGSGRKAHRSSEHPSKDIEKVASFAGVLEKPDQKETNKVHVSVLLFADHSWALPFCDGCTVWLNFCGTKRPDLNTTTLILTGIRWWIIHS
jgi:hypothetical protein